MNLRVHLPALPWYQTVKESSSCAYTQKVRRMADMLTSLGHEAVVYAGEETDTEDAELVPIFNAADRRRFSDITWNANDEVWQLFNQRTIEAIAARKQPGDIVGIIGGNCQQPVADAFPELPAVEWGIGYEGTFSQFRVFESYAWMHAVVAAQSGGASAADGKFYDRVIPNSFDPEEFPFSPTGDGYLLYIGRLIERKGLQIVADIAQRSDRKLVVAGAGDESLVPRGAEYVGSVGPKERADLMGRAAVTLVPTLYLEPFGGVAVESMMCGTPVVTTDFGAFTETVQPGVSGYRAATLREFLDGVEAAAELDRHGVRAWSMRYDVAEVRHQYERYLRQVMEVRHGLGWYSE